MKAINRLLTTLIAAAAVSTSHAALILHYTFDDADISGTTVTDFGTGGNDGAIQATVTTQTGQFGEALLFGAGGSDAVDVGTALLSTTDAFQAYTFSYWVKTTNTGALYAVSQYATSTTGRFGVGIDNGVARYFKGGVMTTVDGTNTSVADDEWHHLVYVKNADQSVNLYVDKVDVTPGGADADDGDFLNTNTLIGTLRYFGTGGDLGTFDGLMDEVQIYDEALNQSQINALFSSNAIPEPSAAVLSLAGLLALIGRRRRS